MTTKEKVERLIELNEKELRALLKKYRIKEVPSLDAVKQGYDLYGTTFMREFLEIVKPISNYSDPEFEFIGPPLPDGSYVSNTGGQNFWSILDSIFGYSEKALNLYQQFKAGPNMATPNTGQYPKTPTQQTNYLPFIIGGIVLIFIMLIFIIFKR